MIQVVSSFSTEPSLDVVLSSIPARIYEAVHFQQQNMDTFTAKVRCLSLSPLTAFERLCKLPHELFNLRVRCQLMLMSAVLHPLNYVPDSPALYQLLGWI